MINTGTTPATPDVPGIAQADVWNSETILQLDTLPRTMIVLGHVRAEAVHRVPGPGPGPGDVIVPSALTTGPRSAPRKLLVATGRTPVTADVGLDRAGVELTDCGFVSVDDELRTTADPVWAAGDIAGGPRFTQAS